MTQKETRIGIIGTGQRSMELLQGLIGRREPPPAPTPISVKPHLVGPKGQAWKCDLEAGRKQLGFTAEQDGGLAHWLVEAPWAHPLWHTYSIILLHLRPVPGQKPPHIYLDGATHEIAVHALNPEADREALVRTGIVGSNVLLHPANYAGQFIEVEDGLALDRVQATVQEIIHGGLSPDTDFLKEWEKRYGDWMNKYRNAERAAEREAKSK